MALKRQQVLDSARCLHCPGLVLRYTLRDIKKRETPSLGSAETPVQQLRLGVKLEGKKQT